MFMYMTCALAVFPANRDGSAEISGRGRADYAKKKTKQKKPFIVVVRYESSAYFLQQNGKKIILF